MSNGLLYLFVNPSPKFIHFNAGTRLKTALMMVRKNFFAIILITVTALVLFLSFAPFEAIGYEGSGIGLTDYERELIGIDNNEVIMKIPIGGIWDILWFIRGQKPGFYNGTGDAGYFAIIGATTGLNAPTLIPGLFFEAITDLTVYLPLLLYPTFTLLHLDVAGMFLLKLGADILLLGIGLGLLVILLLVLTFFAPILIMNLLAASGPIIRLGLGVGILLAIVYVFSLLI
ncbi:MAG: hypothetical protein ACFFD4_08200 [Candidatus Odinarchaeota archaeon]